MDHRLLRGFATLADVGHFGRAASQLCITQSTLSKQIQVLEDELGAPLFARGRHGAVLTPFGALVLSDVTKLLRDADILLARAALAARGELGYLRIGFGLSTLDYAPRCIAKFQQRYPDVAVTLNDFSSAEQCRQILAGELDFGFIRVPADTTLEVIPLFEDQLALVVPLSSPWRAIPQNLDVLNAPGFVAVTAASAPGLFAQIQQWGQSCNFAPRVKQYANDIQTVHAVVSAGLGVALLPCRAARLLPKKVRILPLFGGAAAWQTGLAFQKNSNNPAVATFTALMTGLHP